ncbi:glutamate receptor 2.7-like isoform X2 [Syzygium oleosum]|uniref:glutamate receptor 2.7-like isoform X2 n=1 Tax=Syzygium oleosum TaxID=219896 RepID=UPI0024BAC23B|nr:glutamate receptor 2.7-like isoform X2 [Syzygium oleosum]
MLSFLQSTHDYSKPQTAQNMNPRSLFSIYLLYIPICLFLTPSTCQNVTATTIDVGVILDMDTYVGKMSKTCLEMAIDDFYSAHDDYTTRLVLHTRNATSDAVVATSAAIELLKNYQVKAILGPQQSRQADFIADIGNTTHVPIISFTATSPLLSHLETPYFIRMAQVDTSQLKAIAVIVKAAEWREVVPIYERSHYGSGIISYLADAMQGIGTRIPYRCGISPSATDDQILTELYKLMTMQTRVFIVHMLPNLAYRLFLKANEAGMMRKGYAWIVTDGIASLLSSMDSNVVNSMQGVIGVKTYLPQTKELDQFTKRWEERFHEEYPGINHVQLNAFGLGAYDSIFALAMAVEKADIANSQFSKPAIRNNVTDLETIGVSESGPKLLQSVLNTKLNGLSGRVEFINGQLPISAFQIVNLVGNDAISIGHWAENGIIDQLPASNENSTSEKNYLKKIVWPGKSRRTPKGWDIPANEKKLRIGVPVKAGFSQFINVETDPLTNAPNVTGYCKDVFEAVMKSLPYAVLYEYEPFETSEGSGVSAGSYDELVGNVSTERFDAVIGDITIRANRAEFVDFTLPYTESGVSMIVPIKGDDKKSAWIFLKPLKAELWITIGAFFVYTGIVIWVLEHRVNEDFRGRPYKQIGMILWFSFSTMVYAQRERVISNLSRFVLIIWIFAVLVLSSSYTASLTSLLTVQQLQPTVTDINALIRNGDYIGYQDGSFVPDLLKSLGADELKLIKMNTSEEYYENLSKGSINGGVSAIVDELPYLRAVLAKYCSKYKLVGPTYKAAGFGFAFPKGSPLVPDVSRAILRVMESPDMNLITKAWLGDQDKCSEEDETTLTSNSLPLDSFRGLFIITALASTSALLIFLINFFRENRHILASQQPLKQKVAAIVKTFYEMKEDARKAAKKEKYKEEGIEMAAGGEIHLTPGATSFSNDEQGLFSPDNGLSSPEPGTLYHAWTVTGMDEDRHRKYSFHSNSDSFLYDKI